MDVRKKGIGRALGRKGYFKERSKQDDDGKKEVDDGRKEVDDERKEGS